MRLDEVGCREETRRESGADVEADGLFNDDFMRSLRREFFAPDCDHPWPLNLFGFLDFFAGGTAGCTAEGARAEELEEESSSEETSEATTVSGSWA